MLTLLLLPLLLNLSAFGQDAGDAGLGKEYYAYSSKPVSGSSKTAADKIFMELTYDDKEVSYVKRVVSADRTEVVDIEMLKDGSFISGTRISMGSPDLVDRIWRENDTVYCAGPKPGGKARQYELKPGGLFAVDVSLLYLLRSFPFGNDAVWRVVMADFSQKSITVTVRMAGTERVLVPAGEYECYRMEVIVDVPVFKPIITYWISKEPPHFLVKHKGKLGPFSKQYITEMEKIGPAAIDQN